MKQKQNNGHVTDKRMMARWDEADKRIPVMRGHWYDMCKLKCKTCGSGPKLSVGFYAFTRGDNWRLICCNCPKKALWWELTGVSGQDA